MSDPFRDRVENADGAYPEDWPRPEPGSYIIGEVTNIALDAGKYHQPVLGILDEDSGREYSVWLPQYMREDIVNRDLKVGERVSVKYFGVKQSPRSGNEYQHYALMIDPASHIVSEKKAEAEQKFYENPDPRPAVEATAEDDGLPF